MAQRGDGVEQPRGERGDPAVDGVDADVRDEAQAVLDGGDVEEVHGPVLEAGRARSQVMAVAEHRGDGHRAAGEPWPDQAGDTVAAGQQAADAGREPDDLVEGHRREVGPDGSHVDAIGRRERGGVEQHVPPGVVGLCDEVEGMLDAGEVRLRREGEQVVGARISGSQRRVQGLPVHPQLRRHDGDVRHLRPAAAGELADPVDRVVVVGRQGERATRAEPVRLPDEAQRSGRVGGEDAQELVGRGVEVVADRPSTSLDELGRGARRRVLGVRVTEHLAAQQRGVGVQLARRVQAAAGVIEVHLAGGVEAAVLGVAELGEAALGIEVGVAPPERGLGRTEQIRHDAGRPGDHRAAAG